MGARGAPRTPWPSRWRARCAARPGRRPAPGLTTPIAYRWKTQINENAKIPAFAHELPEARPQRARRLGRRGRASGASAPSSSTTPTRIRASRDRIELTEGLIARRRGAARSAVPTRGKTRGRARLLAGAARRPRVGLPGGAARRGPGAGRADRAAQGRSSCVALSARSSGARPRAMSVHGRSPPARGHGSMQLLLPPAVPGMLEHAACAASSRRDASIDRCWCARTRGAASCVAPRRPEPRTARRCRRRRVRRRPPLRPIAGERRSAREPRPDGATAGRPRRRRPPLAQGRLGRSRAGATVRQRQARELRSSSPSGRPTTSARRSPSSEPWDGYDAACRPTAIVARLRGADAGDQGGRRALRAQATSAARPSCAPPADRRGQKP